MLGLGSWVGFVMFSGGMGITRSIPTLEGQGPPILLARTSVNALAGRSPNPDDYRETPLEPNSNGAAPFVGAQDIEEPIPQVAVDSVNDALKIAEVREALGLTLAAAAPGATSFLHLTPGLSTPDPTVQLAATRPGSTVAPKGSKGSPTPTPPAFSFADNLAPGRPAASVVNFVNSSKDSLDAAIRPLVLSDTGLCAALRVSIAITAKGQKPIVLDTGDLLAATGGKGLRVALKPGVEYTSVVLFNLPISIDNKYQGRTCTVDVVLDIGNPTA